VKALLQSAVSDERLFGSCMMSVHREKTSKDKQGFISTRSQTFAAFVSKWRWQVIWGKLKS